MNCPELISANNANAVSKEIEQRTPQKVGIGLKDRVLIEDFGLAPALRCAVSCAEDANVTNSRFDATSYRSSGGQERGPPVASSKAGGTLGLAGAIEIE